MKTILLILSFYSCINYAHAAITYEAKEYKPKGKHYTAKYNLVYHFYSDMKSEKVIVLYYKNDKGTPVYKGLEVSKTLEDKLPRVVVQFIGLIIADAKMRETRSINEVKKAVQLAIEKALDQKYKNTLLTEGAKLAQDSSYFRGYCNTNWWMPNYYYDYDPSFSSDTVKTFLMNSMTDTRFPGLNYVSDQLKLFGYHHDVENLAKWGVMKKIKSSGTRTIKDYGFVDNSIKDNENYHQRTDSCLYTLKKANISHGKRYPVFASVSIFGWHATYCNFFASDLRKAVFGNSIWSTNGCKSDYTYLSSHSDFVEIEKEAAYKYSNAGYFVFLIDEGHISTVFPNGESFKVDAAEYPKKVVQAGADTGIIEILDPWPDLVYNKKVKCYMYLGYIKSNI